MTDTTDTKALLEKLNAQTNSYDTVIIWDFEAKQLVAAFEAERQRADELKAATLFPGVMCCAKCGFSRTYINVNTSMATLTAGDSKPESCPNGCGPLWQDTYQNQYNALYDHHKATQAELAALKGDQVPYGYYSAETATIMEQQGHANITKTPSGNWQFPLFTRAQCIPDMVHWSADGEWSQAQCLGWNMCRDAMLFTAQQKPVGLPEYKFCPAEHQGSLLWSETEIWNKAIDASKAAIEAAGGIVKEGE